MMNIIDFISANKEWLFNGIVGSVILAVIAIIAIFVGKTLINTSINTSIDKMNLSIGTQYIETQYLQYSENAKEKENHNPPSNPNKSENEKISALEKRVKDIEIEKIQSFLIKHNYFKPILERDRHTLDLLKNLEEKKGVEGSFPYLNDFYERLSIQGLDGWLRLPQQEKENYFKNIMVNSKYGEKYVKPI